MATPQSSSSTPAQSSVPRTKRLAPLTDRQVSVATADHAGTLLRETLHTLDTEEPEESVKHAYIFLVGYDEDGVYLDCFADMTHVLGKSVDGVRAAEKLTGVFDREAARLSHVYAAIGLRARFVQGGHCPGPYCVKTEDPLTREELTTILQHMTTERRKEFLQAAKI